MPQTEARAIWVAGFLDGAGGVRWAQHRGRRHLELSVSSVDLEVAATFRRMTGLRGRLGGQAPSKFGVNTTYRLRYRGPATTAILTFALPHMQHKAKAARYLKLLQEALSG